MHTGTIASSRRLVAVSIGGDSNNNQPAAVATSNPTMSESDFDEASSAASSRDDSGSGSGTGSGTGGSEDDDDDEIESEESVNVEDEGEEEAGVHPDASIRHSDSESSDQEFVLHHAPAATPSRGKGVVEGGMLGGGDDSSSSSSEEESTDDEESETTPISTPYTFNHTHTHTHTAPPSSSPSTSFQRPQSSSVNLPGGGRSFSQNRSTTAAAATLTAPVEQVEAESAHTHMRHSQTHATADAPRTTPLQQKSHPTIITYESNSSSSHAVQLVTDGSNAVGSSSPPSASSPSSSAIVAQSSSAPSTPSSAAASFSGARLSSLPIPPPLESAHDPDSACELCDDYEANVFCSDCNMRLCWGSAGDGTPLGCVIDMHRNSESLSHRRCEWSAATGIGALLPFEAALPTTPQLPSILAREQELRDADARSARDAIERAEREARDRQVEYEAELRREEEQQRREQEIARQREEQRVRRAQEEQEEEDRRIIEEHTMRRRRQEEEAKEEEDRRKQEQEEQEQQPQRERQQEWERKQQPQQLQPQQQQHSPSFSFHPPPQDQPQPPLPLASPPSFSSPPLSPPRAVGPSPLSVVDSCVLSEVLSDPAAWTPMQVCAWLTSLDANFSHLHARFTQHGIDGAMILAITDQQLAQDLSITDASARNRILLGVDLLRVRAKSAIGSVASAGLVSACGRPYPTQLLATADSTLRARGFNLTAEEVSRHAHEHESPYSLAIPYTRAQLLFIVGERNRLIAQLQQENQQLRQQLQQHQQFNNSNEG